MANPSPKRKRVGVARTGGIRTKSRALVLGARMDRRIETLPTEQGSTEGDKECDHNQDRQPDRDVKEDRAAAFLGPRPARMWRLRRRWRRGPGKRASALGAVRSVI